MAANVLSDRDANVQVKQSPSPVKEKPKSLEYHRQVLESRLKNEQSVGESPVNEGSNNARRTQQYISPSDEIMSPATQKLNAFRNKHVMKK